MTEQKQQSEQDPQKRFLQEDGTFLIRGDELIENVVGAFPKAAAVMLRWGLHCVGCHASAFDTVKDGAKLHGMPDEDIATMINEINVAINKRIETIELTERAIKKVRELREKEAGKADWPLRISVKPGGCAGFGYEMDFDQKKAEDHVFDFQGLYVVVDTESFSMLKGSSIDFIDSLMGSGFKIENPNAQKGCGCGKSFG